MSVSRAIRIVVAGGGTGGHVLPAISVLEELGRRRIESEYLWIGSDDGVERDAAARSNLPFVAVQTGKFRRYLDPKTLADAGRVPAGVIQARRHLGAFKPDVVFSTGGFVSVPTVVAATRLAPVLTHEQTAIVGLATKINAHFANVLALSHEQTRALINARRCRVIVTGNPVRLSLLEGNADRGFAYSGFDPGIPMLYVTGGMKGSSPINERIEALLPDVLEHCQILHQAGPPSANGDAARLLNQRAAWPDRYQRRYRVVETVGNELRDVYAAASLVLARAGAGTIAELPLVGTPAILIPLPLSGGGEQNVNAAILGSAGAAVVIQQSDATPERLRNEIVALLTDMNRLQTMASNAKAIARPDAAATLADELLKLAHHQQ